MSYLGSKGGSGVYQKIINEFPPHSIYIEPFLGSGQIMRRKSPAKLNIGVDLDSAVIEQIKPDFPDNDTFFFISGNAFDVLRHFDYKKCNGDVLVYCDPPYLLSTRTSHNRYKYELTEQKHIELLELLNSLPCRVVLSGYQSDLYDQYLRNWRIIEFNAMTRGGVRTEQLWLNFESVPLLHCHNYVGQNYTDRQRIKRKVQRWENKFNDLPIYEQQLIIDALTNSFDRNIKHIGM